MPLDPTTLIDASFFIRDINIPNISKTGPILERLTSFIKRFCPEALIGVLGYSLYKILINETSVRVTSIRDGLEYTDVNGVLRKWQGIVHDTDVSLLANYVYCIYQDSSATQTTGVSTSVSKTEAGTSVSPGDKIVDSWGYFSSQSKELVSFLWNQNQSNTPVYPEFTNDQVWRSLNFCRPINLLGI